MQRIYADFVQQSAENVLMIAICLRMITVKNALPNVKRAQMNAV
jgi:hypothetical protein